MCWRLRRDEWRFSSQFSLHSTLISRSQIWHGGSGRFCQVLLCGSIGCSSIRFPTFPLSPLVWSFSSLVSSSDVNCADECWPSDSQVTVTPSSLPDDMSLSIATVMGYVHTKPIPVVSHFYSFSHRAKAGSIDWQSSQVCIISLTIAFMVEGHILQQK